MQYKETAERTISNSSLPKLFTLCTLQVFTSSDSPRWFCEVLCHFRGFGSATCLIADALQGVLDTVGHYRLPTAHTHRRISCCIWPVYTALVPVLRPYKKRAGKLKSLVN